MVAQDGFGFRGGSVTFLVDRLLLSAVASLFGGTSGAKVGLEGSGSSCWVVCDSGSVVGDSGSVVGDNGSSRGGCMSFKC